MKKSIRSKSFDKFSPRTHLEAIGDKALIDLVLELACKYPEIHDELLNRFSSTDERVVRLETNIRHFKPSSCCDDYDYYGDSKIQEEISRLLNDIEKLVDTPEQAMEFLVQLFEKDTEVMENADQDDVCVGDVFSYDATELFGKLVKKIENKKFIEDILYKLLPHDNYGTRMDLIDNCRNYIPKDNFKSLIERFATSYSRLDANNYAGTSMYNLLKRLLGQYQDSQLFESIFSKLHSPVSPNDCFEIASAWFESGDHQNAFDWLKKIPDTSLWRKLDRLKMLRVIYAKKKAKKEIVDTEYAIFALERNRENFQKLVKVVGTEKGKSVLTDVISQIEKEKQVSYDNVSFLVSVGAVVEAEEYIWRRYSKINSLYDSTALDIAKLMGSQKCYLIATVFYRQLVYNTLKSARSKDYPRCISFMKTLHRIAGKIHDWKNLDQHEQFVTSLKEQFPRRPSFWPHIQ